MQEFQIPTTPTGAEAPAPAPTPTPAAPAAAAPPAPADRPAWLPEKFQSAEALAAAYTELERRMSGAQPGAADNGAPSPAPAPGARLSSETLQPFFDQYRQNGKLKDADYAKLEALGADRTLVDGYIRGQEAQAQANAQRVYDAVGGKAQYDAMIARAAAAAASGQIPAGQIEAYNRLTESGDVDAIAIAARGLMSALSPAAPAAPAPASGPVQGSRGGGGVAPFEDFKQVVAAMRDPRYKNDAGFRAEVDRRLAVSKV